MNIGSAKALPIGPVVAVRNIIIIIIIIT